jgi:hypothetical protein
MPKTIRKTRIPKKSIVVTRRAAAQVGKGFTDVIKKIGQISNTVMKLVNPFLPPQISRFTIPASTALSNLGMGNGKGVKLAGMGNGKGVKLAGMGPRKKKVIYLVKQKK